MAKSLVTKLVKILKDIKIKTKLRLLRSLVFPVTTYVSESWILNASCRMIDDFKMICYKRIIRILWPARRSNDSTTKN